MNFSGNQASNQFFNNADSFAMAFDDSWRVHSSRDNESKLSPTEKIKLTLEQIKDHPFLKSHPEEANQIAKFRLRLLDLN